MHHLNNSNAKEYIKKQVRQNFDLPFHYLNDEKIYFYLTAISFSNVAQLAALLPLIRQNNINTFS